MELAAVAGDPFSADVELAEAPAPGSTVRARIRRAPGGTLLLTAGATLDGTTVTITLTDEQTLSLWNATVWPPHVDVETVLDGESLLVETGTLTIASPPSVDDAISGLPIEPGAVVAHVADADDPHAAAGYRTAAEVTAEVSAAVAVEVAARAAADAGLAPLTITNALDARLDTVETTLPTLATSASVASSIAEVNTDLDAEQTARIAGDAASVATAEAYADAAVAALIDSAPGALDTLNELAAALGDDPNAVATLNTAITARLTQAQGDARYRLLTTAIGTADLAAGSVTAAKVASDVATQAELDALTKAASAVPARNSYLTFAHATRASNAPVLNRLVLAQIIIPRAVTLQSVHVELTAAVANSVARVGLFADNNGDPGALVHEFTTAAQFSGATGGPSTLLTVASALVIQAGVYWLGFVQQVAGATWRSTPATFPAPAAGSDPKGTATVAGKYLNGVTGALASIGSTGLDWVTQMPLVWLREAA